MKTLRIAFLWLALAVAWLPAKLNLKTSPTPPWKNATKLHPGVLHVTWKLSAPRPMSIHAVRVDLQTPGLKIVTFTAPEDAGKPMPDEPKFIIRTRRQTVNNFLKQLRAPHRQGGRRLNAVLGVNASPWSPWHAPFTHKYADNVGLLVSNGKLLCPSNGRPGLAITKDGKAELREFPKGAVDIAPYQLVVCGFFTILRNGQILHQDNPKDLHPRTVFGLDAEKRHLYILVVDGRQKDFSMGANMFELAQLMQSLGATDAINMDGGGSTTLVTWDQKADAPKMLNRTPGGNGTYQRTVGSAIAICLPGTPKHHKAK